MQNDSLQNTFIDIEITHSDTIIYYKGYAFVIYIKLITNSGYIIIVAEKHNILLKLLA